MRGHGDNEELLLNINPARDEDCRPPPPVLLTVLFLQQGPKSPYNKLLNDVPFLATVSCAVAAATL